MPAPSSVNTAPMKFRTSCSLQIISPRLYLTVTRPCVGSMAVMVAGLVYYVALVLVRWFVTPAEPSPPPLRAVRRHLR